MRTLLAGIYAIGLLFAVTETVVQDVEASHLNVVLNALALGALPCIWWIFQRFSTSLLSEVKSMRNELIKVCTIVEERSSQQQQIARLQGDVADMRVEIAKLQPVSPKVRTR